MTDDMDSLLEEQEELWMRQGMDFIRQGTVATCSQAHLLHVVRCVLMAAHAADAHIDDDGDLAFDCLGVKGWVHVMDGNVVFVAPVADGVPPTAEVARELLLLNRKLDAVSVWRLAPSGLVAQTMTLPGQPFATEHLVDAFNAFDAEHTTHHYDLLVRLGKVA